MTRAEVWKVLFDMDAEASKLCEEAWHARNAKDGPEWEGNVRYVTEFAAGFAAGRASCTPSPS